MAKQQNEPADVSVALPFEKTIAQIQLQITELESDQGDHGRDYTTEIRKLRAQYVSLLHKTYDNLSPWETVQVARHPQRPLAMDYIDGIVKNFRELHGDRRFGDDHAMVCGLGQIGTEKAMIITQHKGRDTKEKIDRNFGMARPEGYRKAMRLMKMAEKFSLPVVALIDTPGAYPGIGSEERGVAEAIARNMLEMSRLRTPIVCIVISEGGSGGALGIAVGDRVAMMQFAYYSVISPEGCASILWRTGEKAEEAAEALKLTAPSLAKLGIVDDVIAEPLGGAHRAPTEAAYAMEHYIVKTLRELKRMKVDDLVSARYDAWRDKGTTLDDASKPKPKKAAKKKAVKKAVKKATKK